MVQFDVPAGEMVSDLIPHIRAVHTKKQNDAVDCDARDGATAQRLLMLDVLYLRLARLEEAVNKKDSLNDISLRRRTLQEEAELLYEDVKAV